MTANAAHAAAREPVVLITSDHRDRAPTAKAHQEIATAETPVRYMTSHCTGSSFKRCGNGSQTAPICIQPGESESTIRRATTRCAFAS